MLELPPLISLLSKSVSIYPQNIAVFDQKYGSLSYRQLNELSEQLANKLREHGVKSGSHVGLWMSKSSATVVALFGILKCGAAYIPTDASGPADRNSFIFRDCCVDAILIERELLSRLEQGFAASEYKIEETIAPLATLGLDIVIVTFNNKKIATDNVVEPLSEDLLAYILYTSGSTGKPKGVPHSHKSAMSFLDWCSTEFSPTPTDRFSSHAPFHFDLSILDIYLPLKHGACIYIITESLGKQPALLAEFIATSKLTFWYSTPSILRMLTEFGQLDKQDYSALKMVFFAGEVFPIKQLQQLSNFWKGPAYYNLYGPTETNVCTYYKVTPEDINERQQPVPIGKICSGDEALVVDSKNQIVANGEQGELLIAGGSVMKAYWNSPHKSQEAFYTDASGQQWYKTGDIVTTDDKGDFIYLGRRDRMIKKRGFRVELGEIESVLYRHEDVSEAAVIAFQDDGGELLIYALLSPKYVENKLSVIKMKQFCSQHLPYYMVPDRFKMLDKLPKTSTDKIDYQTLKELI
tara:strand:+ start:339 stop:1904 length:1566 start_codon:yes stop_codon:yes gene_type:complete